MLTVLHYVKAALPTEGLAYWPRKESYWLGTERVECGGHTFGGLQRQYERTDLAPVLRVVRVFPAIVAS